MRLNQFRFLAALKKYGTISRAAQQLYISQPSLSAAIRELEEELGFEVVKRTRKGVIFTAQGEQVLEHSQNILREIESIEQLSSTFGMRFKGTLAVGCVPYIYHSIILDTLMEMKKKYPKTITRLQEDSSYALVELVHQRELDLGVIMMSNIEQANWGTSFQKYQLEYQKLFDDQMYFVVGRKNPLFGRKAATMAELLQYPFVTRRNFLNQYNINMLQQYNREIEFIQIDDSDGLIKYLINSHGVCVMPTCSFWKTSHKVGEHLHAVQIKDFVWTTKLGWIFPKNEHYSVELEEFVELLEENYMNMKMI